MKTVLVVTHAFANYEKGAQISDPDEMAAALETNEAHVVRSLVEDEAPAKTKAAK